MSTSFTLNQSFTSDEIYEVCLRVYYSGCDVTLCKEIPINYDCPDCEVVPNHDFDYIFNPSPPGSLGSSNNFDIDVCEWYQATSTPYYCAYSSNNYIGLWNTQTTQEKVSTKEAIAGLNVNQEYVLTFQYSVQRYYENGPFRIYEGGPNGIDVKFGPYELVTVPGVLPYNIPSKSHNTNDYLASTQECVEPSMLEWVNFEHRFTYISNFLNQKLTFQPLASSQSINWSTVFIDNVCIGPYNICEVPTFDFSIDDCVVDITVYNPTNEEVVYHWDFGDGTTTSSTSDEISHTYLYPGTFQVCVTVTCDEQEDVVHCKTVVISKEGCPMVDCENNEIVVEAQKCSLNGNNSYLGNINIEVPKGYLPCPQAGSFLNIGGSNAVTVNSFNVTSKNSTTDYLDISFNIIPFHGSTFPGSNVNLTFVVCDEEGNPICYEVEVKGYECQICSEITVEATAECDENNSETGHYVYTGEIDLGFSGYSILDVSSTAGGFSYSNTVNGNKFNFTINTNKSGGFQTSALVKVEHNNEEKCFLINIVVSENDACDEDICETTTSLNLTCSSADQLYSYYDLADLTIPAGFEICDIYIEGYGSFVFTTTPSTSNPGDFDIHITMPMGLSMMQTYKLVVKYCDNRLGFYTECYNILFMCTGGGDRIINNHGFNQYQMSDYNDITVYPNPANNNIIIVNNNFMPDTHFQIELRDAMGKIVLKREMNDVRCILDASILSQGIYYLQMNSGRDKLYNRVITILP